MVLDCPEFFCFFFGFVTFHQYRLPSDFGSGPPEVCFELGALFVVLVVWSDALALEVHPAADADIDVLFDSELLPCYMEAKSCSMMHLNLQKKRDRFWTLLPNFSMRWRVVSRICGISLIYIDFKLTVRSGIIVKSFAGV